MAEDITLNTGSTFSNIPANSTLNLCLNGHYIYFAGSSSSTPLFTVNGKLNLYDDADSTADSMHYFNEDWQLITNPSQFAQAKYQVTGGVITGSKYSVVYLNESSAVVSAKNVNAVGNSSTNSNVYGAVYSFRHDKSSSFSNAGSFDAQKYNLKIDGGQYSGNHVSTLGGVIGSQNDRT